jgi:hypothetical protein
MLMPRTVQEILDHADELAARFEQYEPGEAEVTELGELFAAVQARAEAEALVAQRVAAARAAGQSWAIIGTLLGTSGEGARQRYSVSSGGYTVEVTVTETPKRKPRKVAGKQVKKAPLSGTRAAAKQGSKRKVPAG